MSKDSQWWVRRFRHSDFVIRHSSFGFAKSGSWRAPSAARPCIGTMNLPGRRWERRRLAGEDAGAPRPGSWRASIRFSCLHWDHEPTPNPSQEGNGRTRTHACSPPGRGRGWVGSWRASMPCVARIGTMNRGLGVPISRSARLGHATPRRAGARRSGSWVARVACHAFVTTL